MKLSAFRARELALDDAMDEARRLADRAVAVAETTDQVNFHAEILCDRADILALARRPAADVAADVEQALALYERKGNLVMAERTRSRLAEFATSG